MVYLDTGRRPSAETSLTSQGEHTAISTSSDTTSHKHSPTTPLETSPSMEVKSSSPRSVLGASVSSALSGVGQIMFGESPYTGVAFISAITLASPVMAAGTVIGSCIGSISALALGCARSEIKQGLYGFNSSLVGLATMVAFAPSVGSCALMTAGCVAATALTMAFRKLSIPPYTAPFVVTTWLGWSVGKALGLPTSLPTIPLSLPFDPFGAFTGIGQVLFQESALVGLIFAGGLFVSSKKAAGAAVIGALSAGALATATGFSGAAIASGLLGYNAALCAIALKEKPAYAAIASAATLPLCAAFGYLDFPALTAPFVLATWLVGSLTPKKEKR